MSRGKGKTTYTAAQFIKATPGTGGIVSRIAEKVGCNWGTAKRFITNYPTVAAVVEEERQTVLDDAEDVIVGAIRNDKDVQTSKWFLTVKGVDRGWASIHRQEITGADGGPIEYAGNKLDLSGLTDEELEFFTAIIEKLGRSNES